MKDLKDLTYDQLLKARRKLNAELAKIQLEIIKHQNRSRTKKT